MTPEANSGLAMSPTPQKNVSSPIANSYLAASVLAGLLAPMGMPTVT